VSDRASFMAAIRANPADDLPRLVFADWLDENGETERAELIRVMIKYQHGDKVPWDGRSRYAKKVKPVISRVFPVLFEGEAFDHTGGRLADPHPANVRFFKGFVNDFFGHFSSWVEHADAILAESVGLTVRLLTVPPDCGSNGDLLFLLSQRWPDVAGWDLPKRPNGLYWNAGTYDQPQWQQLVASITDPTSPFA
jgi:uncharacterized protein (TIGR02996 family)